MESTGRKAAFTLECPFYTLLQTKRVAGSAATLPNSWAKAQVKTDPFL